MCGVERLLLDVGCGRLKTTQNGYRTIGIDISAKTHADVLCDFEQKGLPFKSNTFSRIVCYAVLEHIYQFIPLMEEMHRVALPHAIIEIRVPHFSGADAYHDPTHVRFFSSRSFNYFITGRYPLYDFYSTCRFHLRKCKISFFPITELGDIKLQEFLGLGLFANHLTSIYERFFCWWFPAKRLEFELEVDK